MDVFFYQNQLYLVISNLALKTIRFMFFTVPKSPAGQNLFRDHFGSAIFGLALILHVFNLVEATYRRFLSYS